MNSLTACLGRHRGYLTYTACHWNIDQAESYLRQLAKHCAALAKHPGLGRGCPDIRAGYYRYLSGSHFVFHRRTDKGIEVVRFLHERMDAPHRL